MRKTTWVTLIALIGGGVLGYFFLAEPLNPERRYVREMSMKFMEDLQFKDFRSSSLYHHKLERNRVDIGRSLEQLFIVKPELLDIVDFRIARMDVDSTENRARVLVRTRIRRLNMKEDLDEGDIMLYWIKRNPDCPIGAHCLDGRCFDESGGLMFKPKEDANPRRLSRRERELRDSTDNELTEEVYRCDPQAEAQWFMNLDSTLKEKRYNQ